MLGKKIQLQENCKKLCPVCTKASWEVLHGFWWIRISINKISRAKMESQTFPEMSDVYMKEDIIVLFTQEKFLSNTNNIIQLIDQDIVTVFKTWCKRGYQLFRWCRFHYLPYCTGFGYHRRKGSCFNYRWHGYFCHAYLSLEVRNEKIYSTNKKCSGVGILHPYSQG